MGISQEKLHSLRHSCAHLLASSVKKLYPQAKLGIGPAIEDGFYYDFDVPEPFTDEDLARIEEKMREESRENLPFERKEMDAADAVSFFRERNEPYKAELIQDLGEDRVSLYRHNGFIDLCKGPHVARTGEIAHFKLLSTSGAYWRGDERNPQLFRIYGTVFSGKDELDAYLNKLEEIKKRDHRVLGRTLGLFEMYPEQAGAGLVFYLPRGAQLRRTIEEWERAEHRRRGYQEIMTPHIMDQKLWERSGHLEFYREYMYPIEKEHQGFVLKPMNCPGHILLYKSELRSWRDLPLRLFELGTVYRYEKSGVLHGLLRVRGFTQDDAHIFCRKEDLEAEIDGVLQFVQDTMQKFGFCDFDAEISTRPGEYIGEEQDWDLAEKVLEEVLKRKRIPYRVNPGDGAFYGPKIDIKLNDALGRQWQCATVQLDYNIPKRFDLTYRSSSGEDRRVVMIHRVLLGSVERFIATLIEHYGGRFPFWLAPVQTVVLSVSEDTREYAGRVRAALLAQGIRAEADVRDETLQKKIRENELQKIPYLLIVGRREQDAGKVSVRRRGGKNIGTMTPEEFVQRINKEENASEVCESQ